MKYLRNEVAIKKFGERLKEVRLSKKISQESLSYEAGIEFSQLSRIERGIINTSISHAYVIAKALKVPVSELFNFED